MYTLCICLHLSEVCACCVSIITEYDIQRHNAPCGWEIRGQGGTRGTPMSYIKAYVPH